MKGIRKRMIKKGIRETISDKSNNITINHL